MGRNLWSGAVAGLVLAGLAACTPPPPYEEVRDPFARPAPPPATAPWSATPPPEEGGPIRRDASGARLPGPDPSIYAPDAPLSATGGAPQTAAPGTAGDTAATSPDAAAGAGALGTETVTVQPVGAAEEGGASDPAPSPDAAEDAPSSSDTVTVETEGGLTERLPDTCQLDNYRSYVGQPGPAANAGVTDRPARVIAPGDIVSQEYNPQRVNFYTDGNGTITRVSCG